MPSDEFSLLSADTFTMRLVGVTEDADAETLTVGLAEHSDGTGRALLFMCELDSEPDDDGDAETYCLCTESGATSYGGFRECVLRDGTLRIRFSRAAALDEAEWDTRARDLLHIVLDGLRTQAPG
jgi:hypothetical protein